MTALAYLNFKNQILAMGLLYHGLPNYMQYDLRGL